MTKQNNVLNLLGKNKKKIKKGLKENSKMIEGLKEMLDCSDIERPKLPLEFESEIGFENYCKDYIEKNKDKITQYANEILLLNEKIKRSEVKDVIGLLYTFLTGFSSFLILKKAEKDGVIAF